MTQHTGEFEHALFNAGFAKRAFSYLGATRDVYEKGAGPSVLLLSEIPGITPQTIALAERLVQAGYAVAMPQLFGEPGAPVGPGRVAREISRACISREFTAFAARKTSPITEWLRGLARELHALHGGNGIGVIGMCFTGGFALAMMVDEHVMAPVLSQPSLPFALIKRNRHELGLSDADLACVKERIEREDLHVLGLRFTRDPAVPPERFARLRAELGDRFVAVDIDSSPSNPHGIKPWAHSVLTNEFVDTPRHPTRAAFEAVLALFERQLVRPGNEARPA